MPSSWIYLLLAGYTSPQDCRAPGGPFGLRPDPAQNDTTDLGFKFKVSGLGMYPRANSAERCFGGSWMHESCPTTWTGSARCHSRLPLQPKPELLTGQLRGSPESDVPSGMKAPRRKVCQTLVQHHILFMQKARNNATGVRNCCQHAPNLMLSLNRFPTGLRSGNHEP